MRRADIAFLLAAALSAAAANAAPVSGKAAMRAAAAVASRGAPLGVALGRSAREVREFAGPKGDPFFAVKLDGGTVFVAGDDEADPVVAFTASQDPDLSEDSPLLKLLRLDATARTRIAEMNASARSASRAKRAWAALAGAADSSRDAKMATASQPPITDVSGISDLRVAPLLASKWDQEDVYAGGWKHCYNYYTPNNWYCGCVATAAAQVMRYHSYPAQTLERKGYECTVVVNSYTVSTQTLYTVGESRKYDWDSMTLVPGYGITERQREAIGRLTYDISIAFGSEYASYGTGAFPHLAGEVFRNGFGYANAWAYWSDSAFESGSGGLHDVRWRRKIIYANLDAGLPVQLGIYGYYKSDPHTDEYLAGHSVVADGYGFVAIDGEPVEYVHINMGWSGIDDVWYNIPEINAANSGAYSGQSGYDFLYMVSATYNIMPTMTGNILSGRVLDGGEPVAGATVFAQKHFSGTLAGIATTDEHGIYSFVMPGTAYYDITAYSPNRLKSATLNNVHLAASRGDTWDVDFLVQYDGNIGNSWGNDLDLVATGGSGEPSAECQEFAPSGFTNAGDGSWLFSFKPAVAGCVYTLYSSWNLKNWAAVGSPVELKPDDIESDGGVTLQFVPSVGVRFWKVEGRDAVR